MHQELLDTPLVGAYLEAAKLIPEVRMILLVGYSPDDARIWTVIDAPPFEVSYRRPLYHAERAAMQRDERSRIGFSLINLQETRDSLEHVLPGGGHILFERPLAAKSFLGEQSLSPSPVV